MKKILKVNKTLIVLGIIVLISIISFIGLYQKTNGVWKNLLPEYNFGSEIKGYRELHFSLDTTEEEKEVYLDDNGNVLGYVEDGKDAQDTSISLVQDENKENEETEEKKASEYKTEKKVIKANEEADITIGNFDLSKEIIQNRFKSLSNLEYNIRMDNITGEIVLEVANDDNVSTAQALVTSKGTFDIIDYQTGIVLLDNADLTGVKPIANYEENGYQLYLQISLNKSGREKISDISKKYVQSKNEAGEDVTKYVAVRFEGQALLSTYFGEEITNGMLTVPIGNPTTDSSEYAEMFEQANRISYILNEEKLPLQYSLTSDNYIKSSITDEFIFIFKIVCTLIIIVISALLIVRYKLNGIILSIVSVGYIALTMLLVRYANVSLTLNSIYTLLACVVFNYIFIIKLLKKLKDASLKNAYVQVLKEYYSLIIPVIVFAVVFTLAPAVTVSSIGMSLFWGLITGIVYNTIVIFSLKLV